MVETIEFKGEVYLKIQSEGFASEFCFPFAKKFCKGKGYDIGCNRLEWCFPGAIPIDPKIDDRFHALELPENEVDYIFSSHCLEHLHFWVDVLDYWHETLRVGGVLFLYLPHPSQKYWLPYNNRKHLNILHPKDIIAYCKDKGYSKVFCSKRDLNHSYTLIAEK